MNNDGWIGVDLDGTLAHYEGWRGVDHVGEPIGAMLFRVKKWLADDINVKIFTARVGAQRDPADAEKARAAIETWCMTHLGRVLEITCTKDYGMIELWDDRAVCVERNTGKILGQNKD